MAFKIRRFIPASPIKKIAGPGEEAPVDRTEKDKIISNKNGTFKRSKDKHGVVTSFEKINNNSNEDPVDPVMEAHAAKYHRRKEFEKTGKNKVAKTVKTKAAPKGVKSDSTPKINKSKPTKKEAPKSKRKVKREDRKNERKAKRNARLDKKIARQTKEGIEAGDGAEKGINSKALAKRRRVDKLKARKAKNNK